MLLDDTELYRVFSICMQFIDTDWSAMAVKKAVHDLATIVFVVQFLHVDQKDFSISVRATSLASLCASQLLQ